MMKSAARSLTDCPGFMNSALPRISQPVRSEGPFNRIRGVLPMAARTSGLISGRDIKLLCANGRTRERNEAALPLQGRRAPACWRSRAAEFLAQLILCALESLFACRRKVLAG